jgi:hypothetical protein
MAPFKDEQILVNYFSSCRDLDLLADHLVPRRSSHPGRGQLLRNSVFPNH